MTTISNLEEATRHFIHELGGGMRIGEVRGDRGPMAIIVSHLYHTYYITFKNGWFYSYSKIYPQEKLPNGKDQIGQSMDEKIIFGGINDSATLVVVLEEGSIYHLEAVEWSRYAKTHGTIRTPKAESRPQYSVPASLVRRMPTQQERWRKTQ